MGLFRRPRHGRILIAERFVAPCARLSSIVLPLDVIARQPVARLRLALFAAEGAAAPRVATLAHPRLSPEESLRLVFAPFDAPAGASFFLGVLEPSEEDGGSTDLQAVRAAAAGRPPIGLACRGDEGFEGAADLLHDERGIAVFGLRPPHPQRQRSPPSPWRLPETRGSAPRICSTPSGAIPTVSTCAAGSTPTSTGCAACGSNRRDGPSGSKPFPTGPICSLSIPSTSMSAMADSPSTSPARPAMQ